MHKHAVGATGSDYYAHCIMAHVPVDTKADVIFGEFAINDAGGRSRLEKHAPYEDSVLETLLTNVANAGQNPLFVSSNFYAEARRETTAGKCSVNIVTGLDVNGYRAMYKKHGVPVLSLSDPFQHEEC